MSDLVKQAKQNVVNIAKSISDIHEILDTIIRFGDKHLYEHATKNEFFEGLSKIRLSVYKDWTHVIELYKQILDSRDNKVTMQQLLDKLEQCQDAYKEVDEIKFRKQAKKESMRLKLMI